MEVEGEVELAMEHTELNDLMDEFLELWGDVEIVDSGPLDGTLRLMIHDSPGVRKAYYPLDPLSPADSARVSLAIMERLLSMGYKLLLGTALTEDGLHEEQC